MVIIVYCMLRFPYATTWLENYTTYHFECSEKSLTSISKKISQSFHSFEMTWLIVQFSTRCQGKALEQKDRTHIWLLKIAMIATSALIALPGCAVGPDYRRPDAPETGSFTAGALPERTVASPVAGGEEQRFVSKQDIPDQWWTLFQCPDLDGLIRLALKDNPSLAAARATLRQAQENLNADTGHSSRVWMHKPRFPGRRSPG